MVNVGNYIEHLKRHEIRKKNKNSYEFQKVDINDHNVNKIVEYVKERSFNSSPHTMMSYLTCLTRLAIFLGDKEFKSATKSDMVDFFDVLTKTEIKKVTVNTYSFKVLNFYWWLFGSRMDGYRKIYPKNINWNHPRKMNNKRLPEEIPNSEEVKNMLNAAERPVEAAVCAVLMEGVMRASELIRCKNGDLEWKPWGAMLRIHSTKTGEQDRMVPLIHSIPYLKAYLNLHPSKHDSQSYLFVDTNRNRPWNLGRPYKYNTIYTIIKKLGKAAKTNYCVSPHKLRHFGLRSMSDDGVGEMTMRKVAGWSENSDMPSVYIRMNSEEVSDVILSKHYGIKPNVSKNNEQMKKFEPIKCSRCSTDNPNENRFCYQCFSPLRADAVLEIDETKETIHQFLERMLNEPKLLKEFEDWKRQDSKT